jgi:hypothetical protein
MKDFVLMLQDIFEFTFQILPPLGNIPNYLFSLVLFAGTVYWLNESAKYSRKAKQDGTYE